MRRSVTIREYRTKEQVQLSQEELLSLRHLTAGKLGITPSGQPGRYDLTATSWIGALEVGDLRIVIRPKIEIGQVLFLLSYALDPKAFRSERFPFAPDDSLLETVVPGFARSLKQALGRGLLQGYRTKEESLSTLRGRVRFDDQIRRRLGLFPPAEVTYDDFTEDIEENRILKAALSRLALTRIRSRLARISLQEFNQSLERVTLVEYHPHQLPATIFSRLNEHYRPALTLAKLILQTSSFELKHGRIRSSAFLVDMNDVFENFVVIALREALGLSNRTFPQGDKDRMPRPLYLDEARRVHLKPDLSWWEHGRCCFVGDVKYKIVKGKAHNPDLYQLLSYLTATALPWGVLVYAQGPSQGMKHFVSTAGKTLEVIPLDLTQSPDRLLLSVEGLAERIASTKLGSAGSGRGPMLATSHAVAS